VSQRQKILLSWSGLGREPYTFRAGASEPGAHLQLLRSSDYAGFFDRHILLCVPETLSDGEKLVRELVALDQPVRTDIQLIKLVDPTDHREIAYAISHFLEQSDDTERLLDHDLYVLLNTGTPQMQTVWMLLKTMGLVDLTILQTSPESLARRSGIPVAREAEVDGDALRNLFSGVQERRSAR
jgi:sigma54-dependent transcription regulator